MYIAMALVFSAGYLMIAFESFTRIDKAAIAVFTGVLLWTLLVLDHGDTARGNLLHHLVEIAAILFFLRAAMAVVELMDAHDAFRVITDRVITRNKTVLLWIISFITFFLSAILDNLTSTIVMLTLLRGLFEDGKERWVYAGAIIIAANAGGAWMPIGDITTTMLWMGGQITTVSVIKQLFLPSLVCMLIPLLLLSFRLRGEVAEKQDDACSVSTESVSARERYMAFFLGIAALLFVPLFKALTGLPPYMGILFGLSVLWLVTEIVHGNKNFEHRHFLSVAGALKRADTTIIFFFFGILLSVAALAEAGHLGALARVLDNHIGNIYVINLLVGLLSAMIDNVPLVAGAMKMYPLVTPEQLATAGERSAWLGQFVVDGHFWEFLAYCAGTGGSCLIIGSAAGVAAMGMEKIDFFWYLKNISLLALLGYLGGAFVYIAMAVI